MTFWSCETIGRNIGMIQIVLSMTAFHSLCQNDQKEVLHDFLVMSCHWHWYQNHVMPTALSMVPLHFLGKDEQNEVQHEFLVMYCHWH